MIDLRHDQKVFVEEAYKHFNKDILTRGEINSFVKKSGLKNPSWLKTCLLYTSPSPRDPKTSRMPSSA